MFDGLPRAFPLAAGLRLSLGKAPAPSAHLAKVALIVMMLTWDLVILGQLDNCAGTQQGGWWVHRSKALASSSMQK